MTDAVALGRPLHRLGALSYDSANLGHVADKVGRVTRVRAETHVVFGKVLDPAITWVELTPDREGAEPVRASVANGYWAARLSPEDQFTPFEVKAGDETGVRFAASVGRGSRYRLKAPDQVPLVEYLDQQQGIRLHHPIIASAPEVEGNRLTIRINSNLTMTAEQRPELRGLGLDELLQREVAERGDGVLEYGRGSLGTHEAVYLLETVRLGSAAVHE